VYVARASKPFFTSHCASFSWRAAAAASPAVARAAELEEVEAAIEPLIAQGGTHPEERAHRSEIEPA
jgi:hypothetical protein